MTTVQGWAGQGRRQQHEVSTEKGEGGRLPALRPLPASHTGVPQAGTSAGCNPSTHTWFAAAGGGPDPPKPTRISQAPQGALAPRQHPGGPLGPAISPHPVPPPHLN